MKQRDMSLLYSLLGRRRVSGSVEEQMAGVVVRNTIEAHFKGPKKLQKAGIVIQHIPTVGLEVQVGNGYNVMFTSHLDTVHREGGAQGLCVDETGLCFAENDDGTPSILGADDAAGVFIMVEMIKARRPGLYMFFFCEERGGIASSEYADCYCPTYIKQCISFDRRGYSDVITHQMSGRCCSNEYAIALSDELSRLFGTKHLVGYHPCDEGVFTDSANFVGIVPECTNVSVGYFREHTVEEYLDTVFLCDLADAMCKVDFSKLPIVRDPAETDIDDPRSWYSEYDDYSDYYKATGVIQLSKEDASVMVNTAADLLTNVDFSDMPASVQQFIEDIYDLLAEKLI